MDLNWPEDKQKEDIKTILQDSRMPEIYHQIQNKFNYDLKKELELALEED